MTLNRGAVLPEAMSRPILERLGFRTVAEITILLDEFGGAAVELSGS